MSDYKFGVGEYKTRAGRDVVIVADDWPNEGFPLVGYIGLEAVEPHVWTKSGQYYEGEEDSKDLAPPEPWTLEFDNGKPCIHYKGFYSFYVCDTEKSKRIVDLLNKGERHE